jgi:site-specific DNA-methyltransferase (adenine-specific)
MASNILDGLRPLAVPIGSVKEMKGNPRRGDVESVAKSLARFGQHRPIVVQRESGEILIGNHTHKAALSLGWDEIAVLYTDDDRETAVARSLADNRTHEQGKYDNAELAALMAEVSVSDDSLLLDAGFGGDEIDALLQLAAVNDADMVAEVTRPNPQPEVEVEGQDVTVSKVESSTRPAKTTTEFDGAPGDAHLFVGDCLDVLAEMPDESFNCVITDPLGGVAPKGTRTNESGFDADDYHGVPGPAFWTEICRVVRPGAWVVVMGSTKSWHRLAVAAEQGGLELRDTLMWLYTTGMTDGLDIGQAVDRKQGGKGEPYFKKAGGMTDERREAWLASRPEDNPWYGWSTAMKPAWKPILLLRRPPKMAAADAAMKHGTAVLNIDGTRVGDEERDAIATYREKVSNEVHGGALNKNRVVTGKTTLGRWPANVVVDEGVADELGDASRFFLCAAASKRERNDGLPAGQVNDHALVRPVELMRWLVRLVCPPGGVVLDPFCGSGSTGVAAVEEGMGFVGVDRNERWVSDIAQHRLAEARVRQSQKARR